MSEEEWTDIVNRMIKTTDSGLRVYSEPSLWGDAIVVGTDAWKDFLRGTAMYLQRRLFWEPRNTIGLTEEGARRYGGLLVSDAKRRARRANRTEAAKRRRAQRSGRGGPSLW